MTTAEKIKALNEERGAKMKEMDTIYNKAESENRGYTPEERAAYDAAKKQALEIKERIADAEEKEKRDLDNAATVGIVKNTSAANKGGEDGEKRNIYRDYSWKKIITRAIKRTSLDGVEAEMDVQERKELQESGVTEISADSTMVPAGVVAYMRNNRAVQRRDMDATSATAAPNNEGSFTIQTNVQGMVDVFLPEMVIGKLPVMRMNNLRGNLRFPQAQTFPSATWTGENTTAAEKSPKLAKVELSPKRLAAKIQLSNQLLIQSESNIQAYANRFLIQASAIEYERAVLKGGGSNEPVGILGSTSNYINLYAGGAATNGTNASGARLIWDDFVNLVTRPKGVNSPTGQAYVTSPAILGRAQITPRQSAGIEGNWILRDFNGGINGFPAYGTTNLPDTFSKGGSVVLSGIIFGDFSNLVLASWGGMEIGIDPYTNMAEGQTNLVLGSYLDCGILNPNAFAGIVDARSY